eukprot:355754-Chlamydomonas_euryale.AAC.7
MASSLRPPAPPLEPFNTTPCCSGWWDTAWLPLTAPFAADKPPISEFWSSRERTTCVALWCGGCVPTCRRGA